MKEFSAREMGVQILLHLADDSSLAREQYGVILHVVHSIFMLTLTLAFAYMSRDVTRRRRRRRRLGVGKFRAHGFVSRARARARASRSRALRTRAKIFRGNCDRSTRRARSLALRFFLSILRIDTILVTFALRHAGRVD
jgi:hypothetical protein